MKAIEKVYKTRTIATYALASIEFEVGAGEFVAITGPSGAGKSTLLAIAALLELPSAGSYQLNGRETSSLSARSRARLRAEALGIVFQSYNLIESLSVVENVALPLAYGGIGRRDCLRRASQALSEIGLGHRQFHYPDQLSGGQQQRVAIARAIVARPLLLLADEPTGNLDSASGQEVIALLARLNREGMTICMVTHDERYAAIARRQVVLRDGKLCCS